MHSPSFGRAITDACEALDEAVADRIMECEHEGRAYCDWTVRLQHIYKELRSALHDAGAEVRPHWRLSPEGTLNRRTQ